MLGDLLVFLQILNRKDEEVRGRDTIPCVTASVPKGDPNGASSLAGGIAKKHRSILQSLGEHRKHIHVKRETD